MIITPGYPYYLWFGNVYFHATLPSSVNQSVHHILQLFLSLLKYQKRKTLESKAIKTGSGQIFMQNCVSNINKWAYIHLMIPQPLKRFFFSPWSVCRYVEISYIYFLSETEWWIRANKSFSPRADFSCDQRPIFPCLSFFSESKIFRVRTHRLSSFRIACAQQLDLKNVRIQSMNL